MPSQPILSKAVLSVVCLTAGLYAGCGNPKAGPAPAPIDPTIPPTAVTPDRTATTTTVASATTAPAANDPAIATVGTTRVTQSELTAPLVEAYGFNMLMLIVQRDLARDACAQSNIKVTPDDVKWEYDWTLSQMFPSVNDGDDREKLLDQYLAQPKPKDQTTTRVELGIIIDTNAHLRKLVEPTVSKGVTDEMLQQLFDEEYGAQVQVRHIVTDNPQDALAARRRLDAGEDFAEVARQVSRDPTTRRLGGELPPFTMNSTRLPDNFKRVAFSLKPGEVSDPVQAGGGYHLIKLEQRIAPKAVKFEDVKGSLRQDYEARMVMEGVKNIRGRLAQQALGQLKITDPTLKAEFDRRLDNRNAALKDQTKIREQMEKDREAARKLAATTAPTTMPVATTTSAPATKPSAPATTKPAALTPATKPAVAPVPVVSPSPEKRPAPPASRPTTAPTLVAPTTKPAAAPFVPPSPEKRVASATTAPASAPTTRP